MPIHRQRLAANGSASLDVALSLTGTVELRNPELWLYIGGANPGFRKIPLNNSNASAADWTVAAVDPSFIGMKVYWDAIEPQQPRALYRAKLAVKGVGKLLKPRGASANPASFDCAVGSPLPHAGSEMAAIDVK